MSAVRIFPVIMSGGSGTRLWPLSTEAVPKQFHALIGAHSLIAETALRMTGARGGCEFLAPIVIAGEAHRDLVHERLSGAGVAPAAVVLEPMGRNTAATAALAALVAAELDTHALVLLMPADHVIADVAAFESAVQRAAQVARTHIVTFGIEPTGPETGYGYIRQGEEVSTGVFDVAAFTEKPQRDVAERYLAEGGHTWNSGVFFFSPSVLLDEFSHAPAIREGAIQALALARRHGVDIRLDGPTFAAVPAAPLDIAVMEKTRRAVVAPCAIGWADIGSWAELWRLADHDADGNAVSGSALLLDVTNTLVRAEGVHVSAAGVSDLVIVATSTAVLVMSRERAQAVKQLIPPGLAGR